MQKIIPAFNVSNNIPIFFACNAQYLPVFSVALQSLISHANSSNNYDIWLLCADVSEIDKIQLYKMVECSNNISLRFLDFKQFIPQQIQEKLYLSRYISMEAYYRIFIPEIFACYDKFLWLDSDITIKEDIANLYNINISNKWVAMTPNIWTIYAANKGDIKPDGVDLIFKDYVEQFLGMSEVSHYCNDGIMIMNAQELRKNNFSGLCLETLNRIKTPNYHDQDLINVVCEEHNYILPLEWNHVWYMQDYAFLKGNISDDLYNGYDNARHHPKIIHYAGSIKPWINPDKWLADDFWEEARKSPFYGKIIVNNTIDKMGYFTKNKAPFNPDWLFIYQVARFKKLNNLRKKYKFLSKFHFLKKWQIYKKYADTLKLALKFVKRKI